MKTKIKGRKLNIEGWRFVDEDFFQENLFWKKRQANCSLSNKENAQLSGHIEFFWLHANYFRHYMIRNSFITVQTQKNAKA